MKSDYYVYCYFRLDTGEPCYIGKGYGERWKSHLKGSHNPHLRRIIAKSCSELPHIKLSVGLTSTQAQEYESAWIRALGREPNGPLVNLTDGGEGTTGYKWSAEQLKALVGNTYRRGKPNSKETRAKISAAGKGKSKPASFVEKISILKKGNKNCLGKTWTPNYKNGTNPLIGIPLSAETRAKISAAKKGKLSPETLERMRQANLGKTRSLESRAKQSASSKGKKRPPISEETRARMSKAAKNRSPEHRANLTAARRLRAKERHNLATLSMSHVPFKEQRAPS